MCISSVKCPGCGDTVPPMWEGCEGVWICPQCYEDLDDLVEDVDAVDRYVPAGKQDPNWSG